MGWGVPWYDLCGSMGKYIWQKVSEYCEEQRKKNVALRNELRALGNDSIFTKKTE